jgi:hypothetical protein
MGRHVGQLGSSLGSAADGSSVPPSGDDRHRRFARRPVHIRTSCELSADGERLLERAMTQHGMTARADDRIL